MKRASSIVIAAALLLLPGCSNNKSPGGTASSSGESPGATAAGAKRAKGLGGAPPAAWTPVPNQPLTDPDQVSSKDGVLNVTLTAEIDTIDVAGSGLKGVRTINGKLGGPTLHVHPGDKIVLTFINKLADNELTNIHYHGLHVDPNGTSDNIFRKFADGTYLSEVTLPPDHPTGTYWYHAHYHTNSEVQIMGGYSGMLIVEGLENLLPQDLQGIPQRQLGLRDIQTNGAASILPAPDPSTGNPILINPNKPSTRLLNSLYQPTFTMKSNQYELWRLANLGADVFYKVQFEEHDFAVIAEDGLPVWKVTTQPELLIAPGKRFDVLVLGKKAGTYHLQSLPYPQHSNSALAPQPVPAATETLATVTVEASSGQIPALPTGLVPEDDLSKATVDASPPPFVFSYLTKPFRAAINNQVFTEDMTPLAAPILGTVEEWTLQNTTTDDHPFHIHVNGFQVMSVNGQPYTANGHQDTVNIPKQYSEGGVTKNGEVVIRTKFSTFPGWFVFHCHILNHEDLGMMATVQVRKDASTPITPPPPPPDPPVVTAHEHGGTPVSEPT